MIKIDGYVIDASLRETHHFDSEVTDYPVETGSSITDNVRLVPIKVTIEAIVSDHPLPGPVATARGDTGTGAALASIPSQDALAVLQLIRDAREPVSIESALQTYDNMVMVSLEVARDADTGFALGFTADFQQVKYVTNNRATIKVAPPQQTGLGKKKDLGNKPTFALEKGAIVWHKQSPAPVWSTSEVLGYSSSDVRTKGSSGLYHADGRPMSQEDLDDYYADEKAWIATHDGSGNLIPTPTQSAAQNQGVISDLGQGEHSTAAVFTQGNGQYVDVQGHPVTYDSQYGHWIEANEGEHLDGLH